MSWSEESQSPDRPTGAISRVLMTADAVGGVWTYCLELARALPGVTFYLAVMGERPSAEQHAEAAALPNIAAVYARECKLEWMDDPWDEVERAGEWLLGIEAETRPDVIHLNGYSHGATPFRAPKAVFAHSCVLSWWRAVKGVNAPARYDRYRRKVTDGLHAAAGIAAPSAWMLAQVEAFYGGALPQPRRVIPNARSARDFIPGAKTDRFFLCAGRLWDEAKNVRALCAIARDLPWPVLVAGETRHPNGSEEMSAPARPPADVVPCRGGDAHFLGRLPTRDLCRWMCRAPVFVAPARYEPFGLAALEAALSGCALVLGDIPSLREVWGDAALFVPPDDSRALRGTLQDLARVGPDRLRALGERARGRALAFSPGATARLTLDLYQEIIAPWRAS